MKDRPDTGTTGKALPAAGGPSLAEAFGAFVAATRFEALPAAVTEAAKLRILDVLGAALAAYGRARHAQLLPLLTSQGATNAWGLRDRLALRDAILLNSFLSHALYLEDGSRFSGGHPSSVVIPCAIAFAEAQGASGRDLIAAVVVGYDVFLRLGRAIYPSTVRRGFQSTSVAGAAASAAAAAHLLRHDPGQARNALAIAATLGVGLIAASTSSGSQPLQVARSCEGGALAALFAGQGAVGAGGIIEDGFLQAFSDAAPAIDMLAGLGSDFRILETYLKMHGGCRGNHAPVDVVQALRLRHGFDAAEIASLRIAIDSVTDRIAIHEPANGTQAQYCVAFAVAAALANGDASIAQYTDAMLQAPHIRALMERIQVAVDPALDHGYPDRRGAHAEVVLRDGRRFRGAIDNARGEPEQPFAASEVERKFFTLARDVLPLGGRRVRDLVMDLESLDDVGTLAAALSSP
ncbi:MmgE/PrpD family protein [Verticiella sediminum]|uniref:MmgE/PrpD family protein n=1 Tax=Verticiella sediminum TaxID=1247510 RepID=A0A556AJQ0_9BURK|nr:MmgE/PrpD family protein [Verticiella sediminum]TSH93085.1 MmgE/PrpD family protein [Verticiella sediminum]